MWDALCILLSRLLIIFSGPEKVRDNVVIATKFAAYPWRLTPGQLVNACKYVTAYPWELPSRLLFFSNQSNSTVYECLQVYILPSYSSFKANEIDILIRLVFGVGSHFWYITRTTR